MGTASPNRTTSRWLSIWDWHWCPSVHAGRFWTSSFFHHRKLDEDGSTAPYVVAPGVNFTFSKEIPSQLQWPIDCCWKNNWCFGELVAASGSQRSCWAFAGSCRILWTFEAATEDPLEEKLWPLLLSLALEIALWRKNYTYFSSYILQENPWPCDSCASICHL